MEQPPVGRRLWVWVVLLGLTGQVAWAVENMYLNLYVFETITDSPTVLASMVAASAAAATIATLLAGAASDRRGSRREFIALGYVAWGMCTAAFGLIGPDSIGGLAPALDAVTAAVAAIIVLDCLMSVLGATANDAAFNAWVTDSTEPGNRGRVDSVLATMPLLAMLLVFGALDPLTQDGQWRLFFGVVGGLTAVMGVAAWWGVREAAVPRPGGTYLSAVMQGLRPASVRQHPTLYVTLATWAVVGISSQVFLPFLIIYVQRFLDIEAYAVVLASVLIGAAVLSILGGRLLDRLGQSRGMAPAIALYVLGLLAMFFARGMVPVIGAGIAVMTGMMLTIAAVSATVRNHTPPERVGEVQGLRMIAAVLVPMVMGPFIGAAVISGADETFVDLGVVKQVPTPWIFPAAALIAVVAVFPARHVTRTPRPANHSTEATP